MSLPRAYIEHVAIRVKDIDWHIGFFREVLGLEIRDELPPNDKIGRQVWVLGSVQLIHDLGFEGPEGRLAHLGIMVDDYDGVLERAANGGAKGLPTGPNWLAPPEGLNAGLSQARQA